MDRASASGAEGCKFESCRNHRENERCPSVEARERILYANFLKVNQEVKDMIAEIQEFYKK
jgi:hypothetical protein